MQENIINGINSGSILPDTTLFTYYANTTHPTTSSLFLANYVHNPRDWSHFFNNIVVYFGILLLIFILEIILLFHKKDERSEKKFYWSLLLFFFVFPFSISGMSLIIFRIIGGTGFNGFSGIVAAFIGYFWFLLYNLYFCFEQDGMIKKIPREMLIFGFFIPIFIFIFLNLISYDNLGGHTMGYVLGFCSSFGMYLTKKKKYDKIIISLLFAIFLWVTATFWIFF